MYVTQETPEKSKKTVAVEFLKDNEMLYNKNNIHIFPL